MCLLDLIDQDLAVTGNHLDLAAEDMPARCAALGDRHKDD